MYDGFWSLCGGFWRGRGLRLRSLCGGFWGGRGRRLRCSMRAHQCAGGMPMGVVLTFAIGILSPAIGWSYSRNIIGGDAASARRHHHASSASTSHTSLGRGPGVAQPFDCLVHRRGVAVQALDCSSTRQVLSWIFVCTLNMRLQWVIHFPREWYASRGRRRWARAAGSLGKEGHRMGGQLCA